MRIRLRHLWESLTSGYWFVPTLMMLAAVALAFGLVYVDRTLIGQEAEFAWMYAGGSDGAKTLLSTVAGSVITVAGVVFSITIAALTQASSQFGPRLLRNFMRDTGNQVVLGTFVATFIYCLLVLRTIHGELEDGVAFVPHASVTAAVALAASSIAVLIYFVHHVSVSLQAPSVVAAVRADLERVIARLEEDHNDAQQRTGSGPQADVPPDDHDRDARAVPSAAEGYLQAVGYDDLIQLASSRDVVLRLVHRPGDWIIRGNPLLYASPADRCADKAFADRINEAIICGSHGTAEQDVEYAIRQMVEVAVRALSPGINDPFTAINCIDALGSSICQVARRGLPGPHRYDERGNLRLVLPVTTFGGITDTAFNQIRQYGRNHVSVMIRVLEILALCADQMRTDEQREAMLHHARMVYQQGAEAITEPSDRQDLRRRWDAVRRALDGARAQADVASSETLD